jgi:hypothetical protein
MAAQTNQASTCIRGGMILGVEEFRIGLFFCSSTARCVRIVTINRQ